MSEPRLLDIDNVARIGLMYLDGDAFEEVLLDRVGFVDYDFERFNRCKIALMKLERINPDLDVTAVLWQSKADNHSVIIPLIAGKALPVEGWQPVLANAEQLRALSGENGVEKQRGNRCASHYYPIRNSDADIIGVLELIVGGGVPTDI
ncbi:hypothetical protein AGMMS49992_13150 [Clostridia bacterium]|nr:hypothetical protein AGMMS49992_13150 [Clostridia bacterium]